MTYIQRELTFLINDVILITVKILKFRTSEKSAVITLKFEQGGSTME